MSEIEFNTLIDKWHYAIKFIYRLEDKPAAMTEGVFKKLFEVAEIAAYSKNERYDYEESLKNFRDWYSVLSTAERKGREEGREKERLVIAKGMKSEGVDIDIIRKLTNLSIEEIEKL